MIFKEKQTALTKEGMDTLPYAELMIDTDTDESRWDAVAKLLEVVADSAGEDPPRIIFGNEAIIFNLLLDLEDVSATLTITRRLGAALG